MRWIDNQKSKWGLDLKKKKKKKKHFFDYFWTLWCVVSCVVFDDWTSWCIGHVSPGLPYRPTKFEDNRTIGMVTVVKSGFRQHRTTDTKPKQHRCQIFINLSKCDIVSLKEARFRRLSLCEWFHYFRKLTFSEVCWLKCLYVCLSVCLSVCLFVC
jgi:hypothetical protein